MKKITEFLKALGAYLIIALILILAVVSVVAELFPAIIPDWMYVAGGIISAQFGVAFFAFVFKEWRSQRKVKRKSATSDALRLK